MSAYTRQSVPTELVAKPYYGETSNLYPVMRSMFIAELAMYLRHVRALHDENHIMVRRSSVVKLLKKSKDDVNEFYDTKAILN